MTLRKFKQVDVFTNEPYSGNPLAIVLDAVGLTTELMTRFANWTNLSETVFILPATDPNADYQVRIFTPSEELPFAGHPTLGACHAWIESGGKPKASPIIQQCAAGLISIKKNQDTYAFMAPERRRTGPLDPNIVEQIARGLNISLQDIQAHEWCENGPPWQTILLRSAELVRQVKPDPSIIRNVDYLGLVGPYQNGPSAFEVRAFFPGQSRLTEDPVTGSLNAAVAQWLISSNRAPAHYVASQGYNVGRNGHIYINMDENKQIWVGGRSITCLSGTVSL